eukprot:m.220690 g.220690  ORF g.220690 m.220690 type:complete len:151 (+) comp22277_c1_seq1:3138-3590(+)
MAVPVFPFSAYGNSHNSWIARCVVGSRDFRNLPRTTRAMADYEGECVCGTRYDNNCAHFLSNWMILDGRLATKPGGSTAWCPAGRPIRAKEMRAVFTGMGLQRSFNPPAGNCFIYCEDNTSHQGHVYYGTRHQLVAGTLGPYGDYFEYYS